MAILRACASSVAPGLVKKGRSRSAGRDDRIGRLHAAELAVRDIQGHPLDLAGLKVSPDPISRATDAVRDEVREWQSRALDRMHPLVILTGEDPRDRQPDGEEQGCSRRPERHRDGQRNLPEPTDGPERGCPMLAFGDERAEGPKSPAHPDRGRGRS